MASETVYDAVLGALTLKQVTDGSYAAGAQPIAGRASGNIDPDQYFGGPAEPRASFSSADVAGVIAGLSMSGGLSVASGTITIPFRKRSNQAGFAGAASHFTVSGTNGLIVPTRFRASQDGEAALADVECWFRSTDGLTMPAAVNVNQSLAAQSFNAQYALGPVTVNGAAIPEIVEVSVNPGITVRSSRHDGGIYPQKLYIVDRRPTIDLTFEDFDEAIAGYLALTAAVVYFRKRSGVGFAADVSTVHCAFSFADGIATAEQLSASGQQDGRCTVRLHGEALTASAASAIS